MANKKPVRSLHKIIIPGMIMLSLMAGCDVLSTIQSYFPRDPQISVADEPVDNEPETAQQITPTPTAVPTEIGKVAVWLPPQFDPQDGSESALIFNAHIDAFRKLYPNAVVDFRIKADSGLNEIVEALAITAKAAPDALPTVVLLSWNDMIAAADQGLIQPIGFFTQELESDDWYVAAWEIGKYKGETYGIPFAVDALVMFTRDQDLGGSYTTLSLMRQQSREFVYAAGNSDSLLPYLWYQSAGGRLADENGQPLLEEQGLNALFSELDTDRQEENIPSNILEFQTEQQVWEAFSNNLVDSAFTWYSSAGTAASDPVVSYIPILGPDPYTYADGWVWCLVHNETADIGMNIQFMEHMASAVFLNDWTGAAHLLPPRHSVDSRENSFIDQLMQSAHLPPDKLIRAYSQEALVSAVQQILLGEAAPQEVTTNLLTRLEEGK